MRDKQEYRAMSVDQVMALDDDEKRRDYLETLLREHVSDANQGAIHAALEAALEDPERLADVDKDDLDEYLTELLDLSTDDGIADVLRAAMSGGHDS